MKIVLTGLFGSINHLKTFVEESIESSIEKKVLSNQIQLIEYSARFLDGKVDYIIPNKAYLLFASVRNLARRPQLTSNQKWKER